MFLPFREVALMGGLLSWQSTPPLVLLTLVDQTDRATLRPPLSTPCCEGGTAHLRGISFTAGTNSSVLPHAGTPVAGRAVGATVGRNAGRVRWRRNTTGSPAAALAVDSLNSPSRKDLPSGTVGVGQARLGGVNGRTASPSPPIVRTNLYIARRNGTLDGRLNH